MTDRDYPYHRGARASMRVVGILLCLMLITIPFGIWVLVRASGARLTLTPAGVTARSMFTVSVRFADVARFGLLRVPLRSGGGVGGALGRQRVGGGTHAWHLCFQSPSGKTTRFLVSHFERYEEITQEIARILDKQPEEMIHGGLGPSWPEVAGAA
jgi:hypothetical protein